MSLRPAPKHAPRVPFALLVLGLLIGGLVMLLALNTASAANEVRRHDIAAKDASISAELEQRKNEVAASQAPGNLAQIAARIGMVPAGNPAFLEIDPSGRVSVLGSPAPASAPPVQPPSTAKKTPKKAKSTRTGIKTETATGARRANKHPSAHPTAHSTPHNTPTPNPTTTLPGGTR